MLNSKKAVGALTLLSLSLGACTTLPKQSPVVLAQPNLPLASNYAITQFDSATDSTDTMPSTAAMRWQDFYNDDKLKALIELGLANNKNLENATLAIQKVAAQYQITNSQALPKLATNASYTRAGTDSVFGDKYTVGLAMASYELDFWGRVASLKEQALQSYLATAAAKDSVQIGLIANIANAYTVLSYAKAQLILAQNTVASREHSLYITQRRFEAGIDSKTPSLQASSSLEQAKMAVYNAEIAVLKAQNALQLLIGSPLPDELSPEPAITSLVASDVFNAGLPSELLYYRPDIVQAEHTLKARGANISAARAAFFPSISLSGNLGVASADLSNLFTSGSASWSFGPSISLPIFDAGARVANYEVAQIEQKQALAQYESVIQTAFREVNDALADRVHVNNRLQSQYKLQENYHHTYEIAYATFKAGLSSYLDVLDAERSLFAIQQNILQLEQARVTDQIRLYQVLGGGANITPTNQSMLASAEQVQALQGDRVPAVLQYRPAITQEEPQNSTDQVDTTNTAPTP